MRKSRDYDDYANHINEEYNGVKENILRKSGPNFASSIKLDRAQTTAVSFRGLSTAKN